MRIPYTDRAERVLAYAQQEARRFQQELVEPEHLLLAILDEGSGLATLLLKRRGVDREALRAELEGQLPMGSSTLPPGELPFDRAMDKVLTCAVQEARQLSRERVGTEHLLLGVLRVSDTRAAQVLNRHGFEFGRTLGWITRLLPEAASSAAEIRLERKQAADKLKAVLGFAVVALVLIAALSYLLLGWERPAPQPAARPGRANIVLDEAAVRSSGIRTGFATVVQVEGEDASGKRGLLPHVKVTLEVPKDAEALRLQQPVMDCVIEASGTLRREDRVPAALAKAGDAGTLTFQCRLSTHEFEQLTVVRIVRIYERH